MFNSLKAFIRQGKQANDLKGKTAGIGETDFAGYSRHDSVGARPLKEQCPTNFSDDIQLTSKDPSGEEITVSYTEADDRLTNQNDTQNYDHVAHQIFQEEQMNKTAEKTPTLENYHLLDKLGEGAFSVVYKARHKTRGTIVAIKVLRKFQMDEAQKQAVLKEVIIMRQLDHPNIVKFVEFVESDHFFYIVQELVAGGEVFGAIVNYTYLSEDLSRHIIYQVAKAVRYLHEEVGIVHRDIKPENILFEPIQFKPSLNPIAKLRRSDDPKTKKDEGEFIHGLGGGTIGTVKIADFGLSKQIWERNTKTPCGTVGYTAPEIVRDERYSKEVDMWAIGCVLYTLLCGFPPFYDERIESLTEKVARGEYTFLAPWWDEIGSDVKYCVSRLLTVDPKKRYTINEFFDDPWMRKIQDRTPPSGHHVAASKSFSNYKHAEMYSPAASALREAFDISAAVHRIGEEAALKKHGLHDCASAVVEEEEESEFSPPGKIPKDINHQNGFALNLGGASILGRRKNKAMAV